MNKTFESNTTLETKKFSSNKKDENLGWAISYLRLLTNGHYFGKVTFSLEDGLIIYLRDKKTLKPNS